MRSAQLDAFWTAFRAADFDAIFNDLTTPDFTFSMPGMPALSGADAIRPLYAAYREAFPDMRREVLTSFERPDELAAETQYHATHRGALAGAQGVIPATGRAVSWISADFLTFRGDRIASWRVYHDPMVMIAQIT